VGEELCFSRSLWLDVMKELRRRGQGKHESGCFLLGSRRGAARHVTGVIYYDELDPDAYASGVCVLYADAFDRLWEECRRRDLEVVADIHTHLGGSFQSEADRTNPMVALPGHIAIIVERFARNPVWRHRLGLYRYEGAHRWTKLGGLNARTVLKSGTLT
jgi:proteasome lid subunit RPN8/RPN11